MTVKIPKFFQQLQGREVIFLSENFPKSQGKWGNCRAASRTSGPGFLHLVRKSVVLEKAGGRPGTDLTQQRNATHSHSASAVVELPCFLWRFPSQANTQDSQMGNWSFVIEIKVE